MKRLFIFLLLSLALAACGGKDNFSPDDGDVQQAGKVSIFESKDSQKKWILDSQEVDFADLNRAALKKPRLLLRENGRDSAEVTGDQGLFDYTKKLVQIQGNARVRSFVHNTVLSTDRFFYDVDKDRVWSDKKTIVTRGGTKVTARGGIETDSKLKRIEFKKQSTRLPLNPKELQEAAK